MPTPLAAADRHMERYDPTLYARMANSDVSE